MVLFKTRFSRPTLKKIRQVAVTGKGISFMFNDKLKSLHNSIWVLQRENCLLTFSTEKQCIVGLPFNYSILCTALSHSNSKENRGG